jgi:tetratricopeptide (TPR) repeat protein
MVQQSKFRIFLSFLSTLTLVILPACVTTTAYEVDMDRAASLVTEHDYTAAADLYNEILATVDDSEPALALVDLYIEWQRPELGLTALEVARSRGITSSEIVTRELALLQQNNMWTEVEQTAKVALENNPNLLAALQALSTIYLHQNRCDDARGVAWQAWEADMDDKLTGLNYSVLQEDSAVFCETLPDLCDLAYRCDGFCYLDIGEELIRMNQWSLASCVLERALASEGDNALVHAWLGESLSRSGHYAAAETHLQKSVALDPENPLGWLLLGTYAMQQGQWEFARPALLNAQRLDPANPAPCLAIAELKADQGLYTEVDTWVEAALERATPDIDIWKAGTRIYLSRHLVQTGMAVRLAENVVRMNAEDGEGHMLLGWAHLLQGETKLAQPEFEQAIALDDAMGQAYYFLGVVLEQLGNYGEAEQAFVHAADSGYFP